MNNSQVLFLVFACVATTLVAADHVGAAYQMTNDAIDNEIIVSGISSNGSLSYVTSVSTGGRGVNGTGSDQLFSQGSLTVYGSFLFAVNALSNTMTAFWIENADPTSLTMIGSPVATGGDFPVSVTATSNIVCVLNGGTNNGIRCWNYNNTMLTVLPGWDRTIGVTGISTPITGAANTLSQILFSQDERALIVSVKAPTSSDSGYVLVYNISSSTLADAPVTSTINGGVFAFSMTLVGKQGLLLTDPAAGAVHVFNYTSSTGATDAATQSAFKLNTSIIPAACWSVYAPTNGHYFIIGGGGGIGEMALTSASTVGATMVGTYTTGLSTSGAIDSAVATYGGVDYLYVLGQRTQVVNVFSLKTAGAMSLVQSYALPSGSTTALQGMATYIMTSQVGALYSINNNQDNNEVLTSAIYSDGRLMPGPSYTTSGKGVSTTAADPLFSQGSVIVQGNVLFVVNAGSNSITAFLVDSSNATKLTTLSVLSTGFDFPVSVAATSSMVCALCGGAWSGFRCWSYTSAYVFTQLSWDRNISLGQTTPPAGPPNTVSTIEFTKDSSAIMVAVKGAATTTEGSVLVYPISGSTLAASPVSNTINGVYLPFTLTRVGSNGVFVVDPASGSVSTLTYSSSTGYTSSNASFSMTNVSSSVAGALCWSAYSSVTGSYYAIGAAGSGTVVEVSVSSSLSTSVVNSYSCASGSGALDSTVGTVTTSNDFLYVVGPRRRVVNVFYLYAAGLAQLKQTFALPSTVTAVVHGAAVYIQSTTTATVSGAASVAVHFVCLASTVLLGCALQNLLL